MAALLQVSAPILEVVTLAMVAGNMALPLAETMVVSTVWRRVLTMHEDEVGGSGSGSGSANIHAHPGVACGRWECGAHAGEHQVGYRRWATSEGTTSGWEHGEG